MSDSAVSERIKIVRKLLKYNQTDFSVKLGITQTSVSQIEREKNGISYDVFKALVNKMGVNPYWLMNGTGNIFSPTAAYDEPQLVTYKSQKTGYNLPVIEEKQLNILTESFGSEDVLDTMPAVNIPWKDSRIDGLIAIQYPKSNMMPNIYPHDWLLCKEINKKDLITGKLYLFVIGNEIVLGSVSSITKNEVEVKFETGVIKAQSLTKKELKVTYEVRMKVSNMLNNVHDFLRDEINQIKKELKKLDTVKIK